MKGTSLIIPAVALVIILVILASYLNIIFIKNGQIEKDIEVRSEMHTMGNALEAAKLYMETALAYSTYQACYDSLKNGGWDTLQGRRTHAGYALWDSTALPPTKDELDANLKKSIRSNLDLYRKQTYRFMTDYFVNLPSYDIDVLMYNPYQLSVGAWNSSNFWIEKLQASGESIKLQKYGFLQGEYTINCYGVYTKGADIHAKAAEAVKKAWADVKAPTTLTASNPDAQKKVDDMLSGYKTSFADNAKAALHALSAADADYDVSVNVLSTDLTWTMGPQQVNGQGATVEVTGYKPEALVKFDVTGIRNGQEFPVFDGKNVVMSPMTLSFVARYTGAA